MIKLSMTILLLAIVLVGCTTSTEDISLAKETVVQATAVGTVSPTLEMEEVVQSDVTVTPTDQAEPTASAVEVEATEEVKEESKPVLPTPIKVRYITPSQQEGPYYPLQKPVDRDNDLLVLTGAAQLPDGEVVFFGGHLFNQSGYPISGAVVEIWQTDEEGIYDHPGDPDYTSRDQNFQFYGEAVTDETGAYYFRTILPGLYEPRPRHIHFKVKIGGETILTSQLYFAHELKLTGLEANLLIELKKGEDMSGQPAWIGERDLIVPID